MGMFGFFPLRQIPNQLQDSGLVACPAGVFTQLMILANTTKWIQIFTTIGGLTTVEIAVGPAGFEVNLFDLHMPGVVNFVIAFNGPFEILAGTRISARPTAAGCSLEMHCSF